MKGDNNIQIPAINQRIQILIDDMADGNVAEFVRMAKINSHQVLNRIFNIDKRTSKYPDVSAKILNAIKLNLPNVNYDWLLTGNGEKYLTTEGEMLKGGDSKGIAETLEGGSSFVQGKIIPLFDATAIGGNGYGMDLTPARQIEMIQIGGFLRESESALRVYGNSMTPNYPPGCIVGTRPWNERFIEPGRVYVVETHENRFLKRLYYNKDKTAYRCLSDNTMIHEAGPAKGEYCYPEFEISLEDVFRMHKVIGVIKRSAI